MADPVVANIVKSKATIYVAPVGTAAPDETSVAYGVAWGGSWVRVGYTKDGVKVAYDSKEFEIEVEEVLAALARLRIGEALTLETMLSEMTGTYLQLAAGGQGTLSTTPPGVGQAGYESWGIGGEVDITEKAWGFEARYKDSSGNEFPIRFFIHKATAKLNGALEFSQKSTNYSGIPLQIAALADTTQSVGAQLFSWYRVTAAAT